MSVLIEKMFMLPADLLSTERLAISPAFATVAVDRKLGAGETLDILSNLGRTLAPSSNAFHLSASFSAPSITSAEVAVSHESRIGGTGFFGRWSWSTFPRMCGDLHQAAIIVGADEIFSVVGTFADVTVCSAVGASWDANLVAKRLKWIEI